MTVRIRDQMPKKRPTSLGSDSPAEDLLYSISQSGQQQQQRRRRHRGGWAKEAEIRLRKSLKTTTTVTIASPAIHKTGANRRKRRESQLNPRAYCHTPTTHTIHIQGAAEWSSHFLRFFCILINFNLERHLSSWPIYLLQEIFITILKLRYSSFIKIGYKNYDFWVFLNYCREVGYSISFFSAPCTTIARNYPQIRYRQKCSFFGKKI